MIGPNFRARFIQLIVGLGELAAFAVVIHGVDRVERVVRSSATGDRKDSHQECCGEKNWGRVLHRWIYGSAAREPLSRETRRAWSDIVFREMIFSTGRS